METPADTDGQMVELQAAACGHPFQIVRCTTKSDRRSRAASCFIKSTSVVDPVTPCVCCILVCVSLCILLVANMAHRKYELGQE